MQWYVKAEDGTAAGPYTTAQMRAMLARGELRLEQHVTQGEGNDWWPAGAWQELAGTPVAASAERASAPAAWQRRIPAWIAGVAIIPSVLLGIVIGMAAASSATASPVAAPVDNAPPNGRGASAPVVANDRPAVAPPPRQPSPEEKLLAVKTLDEAVAITRPLMEDTTETLGDGTIALARWAAQHMTLADVKVARDETTIALVKKDSDEHKGKRLCISGSIVQISVVKAMGAKITEGILMTGARNVVRYLAVGSSGDLVERSPARICGVATGTYSYSNAGGGTSHAIKMVGVFDLPENR